MYAIRSYYVIALNESVDAKLNIQLTRDSSAFITPVFAHDAIGINRDPWSKVNDFCDLMEGELGGMVDIALFKFCYVDLKRKTDIDSLFNHYRITSYNVCYTKLLRCILRWIDIRIG